MLTTLRQAQRRRETNHQQKANEQTATKAPRRNNNNPEKPLLPTLLSPYSTPADQRCPLSASCGDRGVDLHSGDVRCSGPLRSKQVFLSDRRRPIRAIGCPSTSLLRTRAANLFASCRQVRRCGRAGCDRSKSSETRSSLMTRGAPASSTVRTKGVCHRLAKASPRCRHIPSKDEIRSGHTTRSPRRGTPC